MIHIFVLSAKNHSSNYRQSSRQAYILWQHRSASWRIQFNGNTHMSKPGVAALPGLLNDTHLRFICKKPQQQLPAEQQAGIYFMAASFRQLADSVQRQHTYEQAWRSSFAGLAQ